VPPRDSLLARLQRLIERSYDWNTGIEDLGPYLVGDEGYRRLYRGKEIAEELPEGSPGARTLVSWRGPQIRIGVYYPDALVLHLERQNPLRRLDDENVEPFAVLVEELDHLLMLAWCVRHRREVGLLELEFHANVTKYLVLAHFLARLSRRRRLVPSQRSWILHRLFEGAGEGLPAPFCHRYRTAARLAIRLLSHLDSLSGEGRVQALRRLGRRSWMSQRSCLESWDSAERLRLLLAA
jgi:hypothetical protein